MFTSPHARPDWYPPTPVSVLGACWPSAPGHQEGTHAAARGPVQALASACLYGRVINLREMGFIMETLTPPKIYQLCWVLSEYSPNL